MAGALFAMFWMRAMLRSGKSAVVEASKSGWSDYFIRQKRGYHTR
jgi:hypothetical protein